MPVRRCEHRWVSRPDVLAEYHLGDEEIQCTALDGKPHTHAWSACEAEQWDRIEEAS